MFKNRYNKKLNFILYYLILICNLLHASDNSLTNTRNILVIHSYHQGLQWTDNISEGIKSVFKEGDCNIEVHYDYLDTKRNSGENYFQYLVEFQQHKKSLKSINYDLIICSDNNALRYLIEYGQELYNDIPVVFCGVNNFSPSLLQDRGNITGIVEQVDYVSTLDIMHILHPDKEKILIVVDNTPTGLSIKKEFKVIEKNYDGVFEFEYYTSFLLDEVADKISALGSEYLIYLLTFNKDRAGNFISYKEGIEMIHDSSNNPIYGSWDFYFGNGIIGGMITSGYEQGRNAAKLAEYILEGTNADEISIITRSPNKFMFDFNELTKYDVDVGRLPEDSIIINKPESSFNKYKRFFYILFVILVSTLFYIIWKYHVIKREQFLLKKMNYELDIRVAKQTSELISKNKLLLIEINERKVLKTKIRKLASTDSLTGILNRRSFMDSGLMEFNNSLKNNKPLAVLMADLDDFKLINDSFGHHIGDITIKAFTNICRDSIRENDILGRIGGEEFAIILVDSDKDKAVKIAERIRLNVEETTVKANEKSINFSVSIGVTLVLIGDHNITETLKRADKALYLAKDKGRNRVITL